jgi:Icc-related predicted phosphoesterase
MKLHLLSDLHIEFGFWPYPAIDADVVVLAGDIHVGTKGVEWALEQIKGKPVLYVLGNHEYYRQTYPKLVSKIKELAKGTHVQVLENDVTTIDGVNFFGCTLWTDFALQGDPRVAGYQCMQVMNDFKKIRRMPNYSKMRSLDLATIHQTSLNWLAAQLSEHQGQKNVVISHHGPHINSLPEYRRDEMISSAYVSNLTRFINKHQPNLWLHGHVHHACDHRVGDCRVVCNPKGYPGKIAAGFAADLVVDV